MAEKLIAGGFYLAQDNETGSLVYQIKELGNHYAICEPVFEEWTGRVWDGAPFELDIRIVEQDREFYAPPKLDVLNKKERFISHVAKPRAGEEFIGVLGFKHPYKPDRFLKQGYGHAGANLNTYDGLRYIVEPNYDPEYDSEEDNQQLFYAAPELGEVPGLRIPHLVFGNGSLIDEDAARVNRALDRLGV